MKSNKKMINKVAGIIFFLEAANGILCVATWAMEYSLFRIDPIYLSINLCGIIVMATMGVCVLHQERRSRVLNALGMVFLICRTANVFAIITYKYRIFRTAFSYLALSMSYGYRNAKIWYINLFVLWVAFVLSQKASSKDGLEQKQMEKQASIYFEQFQEGILTQEEYNQIIKNNK